MQINLEPSPIFLDAIREAMRIELLTLLSDPNALTVHTDPSGSESSPGKALTSRKKIYRAEDLPDVCTPQIAADFLGISRQRVYEYCLISPEVNGIPSYTIGGSRKIDKQDLLAWKEEQKKLEGLRFVKPRKQKAK